MGNSSTYKELKKMYVDNQMTKAEMTEQSDKRMNLMLDALQFSEKGGIFNSNNNSAKFEAVENGIKIVLTQMNNELPKDINQTPQAYQIMIEAIRAYDNLIMQCQEYTAHSPLTSAGKARKRIVQKIQEQAQRDIAGLHNYMDRMSTIPEGERAQNISEAIGTSRRVLIQKDNGRKLTHVGGAGSDLTKLKEGDLTDESASGYFKAEDVITNASTPDILRNLTEKWIEQLADCKETEKKMLRNKLEATLKSSPEDENWGTITGNMKKDDDYYSNELYHNYVDALQTKARAYKNTALDSHINDSKQLNIQLKEGESVNMSNRNVATSRIASLLGIGDLVAQSETAVFQEEGKAAVKGNLMQAARVEKDAYSVRNELAFPVYNEKKKSEEQIKDEDWQKGLKDKVTGQFLQSLSSLQILDNLVGQVDRHTKNYMIDKNNENFGKVQGIDNDFSFGYNDFQSQKYKNTYKKGEIGSHGGSILDTENYELVIPYMDRALAENILALTKEQVEFVLNDVLEKKAIEFFWKRVEAVKKAIQKEMDEENKLKNGMSNEQKARRSQFLDDEQWDENVSDKLDKFMDSDYKNYVNIFMTYKDQFSPSAALKKEVAAKNLVLHWEQLVANNKLKDAETSYDTLSKLRADAKKSVEYCKKIKLFERIFEAKGELQLEDLPNDLQETLLIVLKDGDTTWEAACKRLNI